MYDAIKSNTINEEEARKIAGDEAVDAVMAENCEFTNRVIDACFGVTEMSSSVEFSGKDGDDYVLEMLYLVDSADLVDCDDLGDLDYSNYAFQIN